MQQVAAQLGQQAVGLILKFGHFELKKSYKKI